jgi:calcineurin-like phosphoesterase family protein
MRSVKRILTLLAVVIVAAVAAGPVRGLVGGDDGAGVPAAGWPEAIRAPHATVRGPGVTVVAAGDIACDPFDGDFNGGLGSGSNCRHAAVASVIARLDPDAVLALGDNQYEEGAHDDYLASYDASWGRFLPITYPAPGNHEFKTDGAAGYFKYFGERAGRAGAGWYSFDLGKWHLVALNSNCGDVGGCDRGSPQYEWLRRDLAVNARACTLAYWHHPLFSSGPHGDQSDVRPLWAVLHAAGADVVLAGHDHDYERFRPMTAAGARAPRTGVRGFVVGTGGKQHYRIDGVRPNSVVHDDSTYGVLELTLMAEGYRWRFVPAAGGTFTDEGAARCHD